MRFSAVIFDFDGTLCDTGPGIMNSAAYALEAYGFEVPREPGALRCFIGPPLLVTFQEQFGADAATAQALVQKYRERYNGAILNESMLYRGIVTLLENLKAAGIRTDGRPRNPENGTPRFCRPVQSYGTRWSTDAHSSHNQYKVPDPAQW